MKPVIRNAAYPLLIIVLTITACVYYWLTLIDTQQNEMEAARHRGELQVQQINGAVDQELDAMLRSVDTVLRHLRVEYLHNRKNFDRSVRDVLAAYPKGMLQFVSVVGSDGYLTYLSELKQNTKPDHVYMGDREHIQVHVNSKEDNLFISKPLVGRIIKAPLIQLTRPIREGNYFVGVIGIPLSPVYLSDNLSSLSINPNDLISIVREDGRIIARSRKLEEGLILTTPPDRPFMHSHPGEHGIFRNVSITDKVPLLFSWRHLANYPIIAVTAIDEVAELSGVSEQQSIIRKRTILSMTLVVSFALWISFLIIRSNRKNHELVQSQENLLQSEQRWKFALEGSAEGVWERNLQTNKIKVTKQFEAILGFDEGEYGNNGDTWRNSIHPEDRPSVLKTLQAFLESEAATYLNEYRLLCKDGNYKWVLSRGMVTERDKDGKPQRLIGTLTDISERKKAEQAMKKESEKNLALLRNASDGIHILNMEGNIIEASDSFCRMVGYQREEVIGMNVSQWDVVLEKSEMPKIIRQHYAQQKREQFNSRHRRKDGTFFDVEISGLPILLEGNPVMFYSSRDITVRKKHEWQLAQLNLALNHVKEAAYLMNEDGRFLYVNDEACRVLGYSREELIGGMGVPDIDDGWTKEQMHEHWKAIKVDGHRTLEAFHRARDGHLFPIEVNTNYFEYDGQGYNLALVRDITERKKYEADIRIAATAFESQEGMSITDEKGIILRVNRAFTRITGYTAEEAIGKSNKLMKSGRHDEKFYADMWEKLNRTGLWEGEIWNRRKNGEVYPEYLNISAVKNNEGIVTNYVSTLTDITLTKAAEDEIKHLAFYDPLTRLPNRRLLLDRLRQALASIARSGCAGALLFIDLDNFKTLNDTLGHDIGDLLLQQVAKRLESCVREGDTVARLGGDEFVIMLEDLSKDPIVAAELSEHIGNKILSSLNQTYQLASHEYHNTPSIGATLFNDNSVSVDDLMKQADIAMYQSKKSGRNTLRFFDPQMQETVNARARLEADLRKALENNELEVFYQPIVETKSGKIYKAEALLRWKHPTRGMISPATFIPLAEESGLILEIGEWVFMQALNTIEHWKNETGQLIQVSVNKSPVQFVRADRHPWLERLENSRLPKGCIAVEITEGLLTTDSDKIRDELLSFQNRGIEVSIDDFGTGFSALSYLNQFDIDYLKIDISFIKSIVDSESNRALTEAIIVMAHKLGIKTIAEGVETEAQRDLLFQFDCDYIQGFLYSKPVTATEFIKLIHT